MNRSINRNLVISNETLCQIIFSLFKRTHIYNSRILCLSTCLFLFLCLSLYTMYIVILFLWLIKRWLIKILLLGILLVSIGFGFCVCLLMLHNALLLSVVYQCIYRFSFSSLFRISLHCCLYIKNKTKQKKRNLFLFRLLHQFYYCCVVFVFLFLLTMM